MTEILSAVPKQEHIDRLLANPDEADAFDKTYGEGASLKYLPAEKVTETEEDKPEQPETDRTFLGNVKSAAKETGRETLETIQGISNYLKETFPDFNYTIRSDEDGIRIVSPDEMREEKIEEGKDPDKFEGGLFQNIADTIPESPKPEGVVGSLTRGVGQFSLGFVMGGRILNSLKWTRGTSTGLNVARSFVQGGIADFTVFDEKEARLSDFIIEVVPEANDTFIGYMAADENDTFFEGKFKNVLEGSLVGGSAELLFRLAKFINGTRKRLDKGDKKGAKEYAEKEAEGIEKLQKQVEAEQLELFPDDPRIKPKKIDEVELNKPSRGLKEGTRFSIKSIKGDDYFKNVKLVIEKIRTGDADVDDLMEITTSLKWVKDDVDAVRLIRVISDEVNKVTKEFDETKQFSQVWRQVDDMVDEPAKVIRNAQRFAEEGKDGDAINLALRMVMKGLLNTHHQKYTLYKAGQLSEKEVRDSLDIVTTLVRLDKELGNNSARALNIRKVLSDAETKSAKKIKKILEDTEITRTGDDNRQAQLDAMDKINKAKGNPEGVMSVLKRYQEKLGINGVNKFYINALLSNPKTHAINMTSNLIMAVVRPMEHFIGGVIYRDQAARMEAIETAVGLLKYFTDSMYMAKQSFLKSDSILDKNNFKVDLDKGAFRKDAGTIEKVIESPTRFLSAEDEFFKQLNFRAKLFGRLTVQGIKLGLSRKKVFKTSDGKTYSELDQYVTNKFDDAFEPDGSPKEMYRDILEYAQENTFTKALGKGTLGKKVQELVNTVPITRQFMPFVRTPINIMRAVQDRSPLFFARQAFREELTSPDRNIRAAAMGKVLLGNGIFAVGGYLAYNGIITGGVPKDTNLRRQKFDTGWRPYSFRLGGKYYSYERLDPFFMPLGLMADYYAISNELTEDERAELAEANMLALFNQMTIGDFGGIAGGAVMSTAKNITGKTYLKSLTDILDTLSSDDPRKWKRYGLTRAGSYVPNILKGIANDPLYRDARNLTDALKTRVPFIGDAPLSYNAIGEPRSRNQSWWDSFLNPVSITEEIDDKVIKEFDRLGFGFDPLNNLQGYSGNIDLLNFKNADGVTAYDRWNQLISKDGVLREQLLNTINSQAYNEILQDAPISEDQTYKSSRATMLRKIINARRNAVRLQLLREGFVTEENLSLSKAYANDKINQFNAKVGNPLLPTK